MARLRVPGRKLRFRFVASVSLVLAMLVALVGFAQSASAHSLSLTGVASCQEDGTFTITWTLSNDYGLDSVFALDLCTALEHEFGILAQPTIAWDYPTIDAVARHLAEVARAAS